MEETQIKGKILENGLSLMEIELECWLWSESEMWVHFWSFILGKETYFEKNGHPSKVIFKVFFFWKSFIHTGPIDSSSNLLS